MDIDDLHFHNLRTYVRTYVSYLSLCLLKMRNVLDKNVHMDGNIIFILFICMYVCMYVY